MLNHTMNKDRVKVNARGQLVIPSRIREKYGLRKGTQVTFVEDGYRIILQPLTSEFVRSLRGSLKGKQSLLKCLLEERKQERRLI
jgi:AbrB family looped-hinge helix DNA binding protein